MNAKKDEPTSRQDASEALHSALLLCDHHRLNLLDASIQICPQGMSFATDSEFAPFTELRIRLKLPPSLGSLGGHTIDCEGVVVECRGNHQRKIFQVTVAFLNLSEHDQKLLSLARSFSPAGIESVSTQNRGFLTSYGD